MARLEETVRALFTGDPTQDRRVETKARLVLLDTLGCVIAGLQAPEVAQLERRLAMVDAGVFRFPQGSARMAPSSATSLFAVAACWDEACEGLARAHGRPGVPSLAACLPLAWVTGKRLGALLRALVIGYEVGGRLGEVMRMRPGMHVDATWPSLAATAAVAHLLGFSAEQALAAIQLAASHLPFSLYAPVKDGANGRNTFLAHAAAHGLSSALAIEAGMAAPRKALEETWKLALGGKGTFPELAPPEVSMTLEAYLKPYAGVRHLHYGAEAALALRPKLVHPLAAVSAIRLEIYEEAITYCGNRAPRTAIQAQFSLSWGVAAALVLGSLGPDAYRAERLRDPEVRRLEQLVEIVPDPARTAAGARGAVLSVTYAGTSLTERVDAVAGDAGMPMSEQAVREKFMQYAAGAIGEAPCAALMRQVLAARPELPVSRLW